MQQKTTWVASLLDSVDRQTSALARAAAYFGWRVVALPNLDELSRWSQLHHVAVVLFNPDELGRPAEALNEVLHAAPNARTVACNSRSFDLPDAYTSLMLPLAEGELRQVFGFVWAQQTQPPMLEANSQIPVRVGNAA